jgi:hypothetical protein
VQRRTVILSVGGGGCGCLLLLLLLTCGGAFTFFKARYHYREANAISRKAFRGTVMGATDDEVRKWLGQPEDIGGPWRRADGGVDYFLRYFQRTIDPKTGKLDRDVVVWIDITGRVSNVLFYPEEGNKGEDDD